MANAARCKTFRRAPPVRRSGSITAVAFHRRQKAGRVLHRSPETRPRASSASDAPAESGSTIPDRNAPAARPHKRRTRSKRMNRRQHRAQIRSVISADRAAPDRRVRLKYLTEHPAFANSTSAEVHSDPRRRLYSIESAAIRHVAPKRRRATTPHPKEVWSYASLRTTDRLLIASPLVPSRRRSIATRFARPQLCAPERDRGGWRAQVYSRLRNGNRSFPRSIR